MNVQHNPESTRGGFTLIELLVVISIIAILAAIIFPVFATAREKARQSTCQSNMRMIGIAFQLYLADYNDTYPCTGDYHLWMGRWWRWPLQPYLALAATKGDQQHPGDVRYSTSNSLQTILACPSDSAALNSYDDTSYAYSMSFYFSPAQIDAMTSPADTYSDPGLPCTPQTASAVIDPSRKAMLGEWVSNHESPHVGWWGENTNGVWGQHAWEGARNYVFADGHCRYLHANQLNPANDGFPDINLTHNGIAGTDLKD